MKLKSFLRLCLSGIAATLLLSPLATMAAEDARPVVDDSKVVPESAANPNLHTIYIVGDSTLKSNAPLRGWGDEIAPFFDLSKINVVNRAIGGRSSRTFMTDGRWDKILTTLKAGDFVLVQFGHNDNGDYKNPAAKGRPSIRGEGEDTAMAVKADGITQESIHSFGWYMRKYGSDAKAKGASAVFCSMVPHKVWKDGKIMRGESETFVKWTQNAAKASGAAYINLNEISALGLEKMTPQQVDLLFGDPRTHSTPAGAEYNAGCVISGLKALPNAPLDSYLSDKGRAVKPAEPQFVVGAP